VDTLDVLTDSWRQKALQLKVSHSTDSRCTNAPSHRPYAGRLAPITVHIIWYGNDVILSNPLHPIRCPWYTTGESTGCDVSSHLIQPAMKILGWAQIEKARFYDRPPYDPNHSIDFSYWNGNAYSRRTECSSHSMKIHSGEMVGLFMDPKREEKSSDRKEETIEHSKDIRPINDAFV